MNWVYFFEDAVPGDAKVLLGGKGASLGEMTRAGLNVPPGFTITTEACRYFYEHGQQWPPELEQQIRAGVARLEQLTGRRFGRGRNPLFVSVRSGAAVSMPGMMDTILNCGITEQLAEEVGDAPVFWHVYQQFIATFGRTVAGLPASLFVESSHASRVTVHDMLRVFTQNTGRPFPQEPWDLLVECINAVFRSWSSERAHAYRKRNHIEGLIGTAVNVQVMFPSRVAGVAFTQDPNNLRAGQMVIESAFGLGEAVVSGDVTPDRYVVSRNNFRDVKVFPGKKSNAVTALGDERAHAADALTLSSGALVELCALCLKVEKFFGKPMDIEWGWADGKFALLQSRAIRGLDVAQDAEEAREEEILRLRQLANGRHRVWVTHNLRETLRAPTPLTWDIVRRFMSGAGGFGLMYRDFGYEPSGEVCREGFLELILGRIYADPERLSQLFWGGLPVGYDVQAILRNKNEMERPPTRFEPEKADETFLFKLPGAIKVMIRASRATRKLRPKAKEHFEKEILPGYLEYVRAKRSQNLEGLSTAELLAELTGRRRRVLDEFGKESLKPPFFAGVALGALEGLLTQLMGAQEGGRYATVLTMGLEHDSTYEQDLMLSQVAAGQVKLEEFLDRYGHRATNEMELSEPRWREDATFLEQVLAQMRSGGGRPLEQMHRENVGKMREAVRELPSKLAQWGGSSLREEIECDLREARELLPYRETGKHYLMMGYELIRLVVVELGRRWRLGNDIFYLLLDELERWEAACDELRPAIERRKVRWKSVQRLDLPDVVDSEHLEKLGLPPVIENAQELAGDAVSSGVATGVARIVFNPREVGQLGKDYVLVCPSTDPGWTPLFVNARGLVVERGGVLSHGAIVARDFGIPAVVCPHATTLLQDGEKIRVDGNQGRITKLGGGS